MYSRRGAGVLDLCANQKELWERVGKAPCSELNSPSASSPGPALTMAPRGCWERGLCGCHSLLLSEPEASAKPRLLASSEPLSSWSCGSNFPGNSRSSEGLAPTVCWEGAFTTWIGPWGLW